MICMCESEIILYHLHLYTRRVYPGIAFHEAALRATLRQAGITTMRQLFALSASERKQLADRVLEQLPSVTTQVTDQAA